MINPAHVSPYTSLISFALGFPTAMATYYQAWKARQENRDLREGLALSSFCLEFVNGDGVSVNVATLDSLHSLPTVGEVVLLPGMERKAGVPLYQAFRIREVEHLYAPTDTRSAVPGQAHLVKIVAKVATLASSAQAEHPHAVEVAEAREPAAPGRALQS